MPLIPLTDEVLEDVDLPDGVTFWVSKTRPRSVTTALGTHEGDIIRFFVETEDSYILHEYQVEWYRYEPKYKDEEDAEAFRTLLEENYRPLSGESE